MMSEMKTEGTGGLRCRPALASMRWDGACAFKTVEDASATKAKAATGAGGTARLEFVEQGSQDGN